MGAKMSDSKYTVVLTKDEEQPEIFNVTVPALPGCFTWGFGRREALKNAIEAIELYLDCISEKDISYSEVTICRPIDISPKPSSFPPATPFDCHWPFWCDNSSKDLKMVRMWTPQAGSVLVECINNSRNGRIVTTTSNECFKNVKYVDISDRKLPFLCISNKTFYAISSDDIQSGLCALVCKNDH